MAMPAPPNMEQRAVSEQDMRTFSREELELRAMTDRAMELADGVQSNGILTRTEIEETLSGLGDAPSGIESFKFTL